MKYGVSKCVHIYKGTLVMSNKKTLSSEEKEKLFNTIMPETTSRIICIQIEKPVSRAGYEGNFLPKIEKMLQQHGEIRILIFYKHFKGWEKEAAVMDLYTTARYGRHIVKMALVNPPEREIVSKTVKKSLLAGDLQFFAKEDLARALEWVGI